MITLRRESLNFNRQADAKISVLREVIRRVQNGEEVDVEGLLGTGNKEKEREWAELLQEIEEEDILWQSKSKKKPESKPETGEKNTSNEEAAQSKDSHVWI
ncbi:MAG: hypothetical protein M1829_003213 [Trizodia sp. TS-e1964]|nr:MAG: hypothetical protein M1829_003213 [Trizodia sp. TS-e1964]